MNKTLHLLRQRLYPNYGQIVGLQHKESSEDAIDRAHRVAHNLRVVKGYVLAPRWWQSFMGRRIQLERLIDDLEAEFVDMTGLTSSADLWGRSLSPPAFLEFLAFATTQKVLAEYESIALGCAYFEHPTPVLFPVSRHVQLAATRVPRRFAAALLSAGIPRHKIAPILVFGGCSHHEALQYTNNPKTPFSQHDDFCLPK
jgi:hypothetical protein